MIWEIGVEQAVEVLTVPHATRCAAPAREPSLPGCPVYAVQLERQQVFEPTLNLFPRNVSDPTDREMRMSRIESGALKPPSFFIADLMYEREDLALYLLVETHGILRRCVVVRVRNILVG